MKCWLWGLNVQIDEIILYFRYSEMESYDLAYLLNSL